MVIKPTGLTHGHYECRSLKETLPVLSDLLGLEVVAERDRQMIMKHPNTDWLLVVHEAGPAAKDKPLMNHYGVRVQNRDDVDNAWEHLKRHKAKYRLGKITKPQGAHYAHSFYFKEPGGNYLEIESYDPEAAAEGRSIAAPHWRAPLGEDRFPGSGYVPQALSHGTLECDDKGASDRFYRDVLGLEIAGGGRLSTYIKHPATPWYVVVIPGRKRTYLSPSNRFTLSLPSPAEVDAAHREFSEGGRTLGITSLEPITREGRNVSFLFADLDRNWWEVIATAGV